MTDIVLPGRTAAVLACDQVLREMEGRNPARAQAIRIVRMHLERIKTESTPAIEAPAEPRVR